MLCRYCADDVHKLCRYVAQIVQIRCTKCADALHKVCRWLAQIRSIMFDGAFHLAAILFGFQRLSLVVLFLTAAEGDIHLGASVLVDKH